MRVRVRIREKRGCKDEYFPQSVVVLRINNEAFLVHCLHFPTTVGYTECSLFSSPVNIVQENR